MERKNFDYDPMTDGLIVSRKQEGEIVEGSAEVRNLILDFTEDGKIVSIEVRNISDILEDMKIDPSILEKLGECSLDVQQQGDEISFFVLLNGEGFSERISVGAVHLVIPVASAN